MSKKKRIAVLVLDLDGTVRKGFDELGRFVNCAEDVEVFPEAVALMREWKAKGGRIIAASNQGGISLGHMSMEACVKAMTETYLQSDRLFDKIAFCRHHPQAKNPEYARCWCRKPAPGLVIETLLDLARATGEIYPPHLALFVGDREEDRSCAATLNMDFMWAKDWRLLANPPESQDEKGRWHRHAPKEVPYG